MSGLEQLDLLEAVQQAVIATDPEGKIVFWNAFAERLYGWRADEVLGRSVTDLLVAPQRRAESAVVLARLRASESVLGEFSLARRDGSAILAWVQLAPLLDERGRLRGMLGMSFDYRERKAAQESLRRSEARYRALVEAGSAAVWRTDASGELTWSSSSFRRLSGLSLESAQGEGWLGAIHPNERTAADAAWHRALERTEPYDLELRVRGEDGRYRWVHSRAVPVLDEQGRVLEWVGSDTDITERKAAEGQATRLARVLESSLNEIYLFDAETLRFSHVNRGARENLGYSVAELARMTPLDLKPEFDETSFAALLAPLRRGRVPVVAFETVHQRKDGSRYPVEVHLQLFRDESPPIFAAVILDISHRQQQEERLQMLAAASRLLSTSLDYGATLQQVADLAVPRLADWCAITLQDQGEITTVALAHRNPAKVAAARELRARYPVREDTGAPKVIRSGAPALYPEISEEAIAAYARDERELELLREVNYRSVLIVPLKARGKTLGALSLVYSETPRRYGEDDLPFAEELASRAASAIDNAQLYRDAEEARQALAALNAELEARVRRRTREVSDLSAQLTLTEGRERTRLAQILHDDLQQQLYAVQFALHRIEQGAGSLEVEPLKAELAEVQAALKEAAVTARDVTTNLSPPVLKNEGLTEALGWLASHIAERHGLRIAVEAPSALTVPSEAVRVLLFNLVRELLFNVVKHADVERAQVGLLEQGGWLTIAVRDEGRGFVPEAITTSQSTGLGLSGMRRRLELFGGELEIASAPGVGTSVTVRLPIAVLTLER